MPLCFVCAYAFVYVSLWLCARETRAEESDVVILRLDRGGVKPRVTFFFPKISTGVK